MPDECRYLKTRLQIEYSRLLDWCDTAGVIEYKNGEDLPDSLNANRFILIAILTEIRTSMDNLADINGKYIELQPETSLKDTTSILGQDGFSGISLTYERKSTRRKYPRGLNHIAQGTAMARDIVKNPRRLQWVAFDKDVFVMLLRRLTELNDHLHELLRGHQARALEVATHRTYLEMVQVRTSVEELKHLVTAAMLLQEPVSGGSAYSTTRHRNEKALASLADFKSLNAANDAPFERKPPTYDSVMGKTSLAYSQIHYKESEDPNPRSSTGTRVDGKFYPGDCTEHHIWIEWKTYKVKRDRRRHTPVPLKENVMRVKELVALLKADKAKEFFAPRCLGYFDDRDDTEDSEHDFRFGLVFEKPTSHCTPVSLHQLISREGFKKPSFTDRAALAHKIATCILYLHAVSWLHKGLRSDNVLFFLQQGGTAMTQPYLTGYEYARPDKDGETTTGGDINEWWELYVHPNYQGSAAKGTYRKTFDIYSLGIILLEICYWQKIEDIIGIDPEKATMDELRSVRSQLMSRADILEKIRSDHGDRFHTAVKACIEGRSAFGIGQDENENNIDTGAKLQQEFTRLVVDSLEGISI